MNKPQITYERDVEIASVDAFQISLSALYIEPNLAQLTSCLAELREEIDYYFNFLKEGGDKNNFSPEVQISVDNQKESRNKQFLEVFPIGACYAITHAAFPVMKKRIEENSKLNFVKCFIENGGVFKVIWGQLRNEFFQTCFQLGAYYVDISNDTVVVTKPKLEICLLKDSAFKNISTFQEFFDIKEKYHEVEIYPNLYFPNLAPFVPAFSVQNGKVTLLSRYFLFLLIVRLNGLELNTYLANNFTKKLPDNLLQAVENQFSSIQGNSYFNALTEKIEYNLSHVAWQFSEQDLSKLEESYEKTMRILKFCKLGIYAT
jgi:hypothetical protein